MTTDFSSRRRTAVVRSPNEEHRSSTPLELLFDLCFVVAVAQVAAELHHGIIEGRAGEAVIGYVTVFIAVWWAWLNFSWFASGHDSDDVPYRLLTMMQMAGVLVLAAGVREAIVEREFAVLVIGYVVMRLALVAQWLRVGRDHPRERARALHYALGIVAVQLLWIGRLWLPNSVALASFAILMLVEMYVPWSAERHGQMRFHVDHIVERYGLFTIIVLGETILSATVAVDNAIDADGLSFEILAIAIGGLAVALAAWWAYFAHPGQPDIERQWSSFLWGYGHAPVFAGLAAFGAGIQVATEALTHPDEVSARAAAVAVTVPVAITLAGLMIISAADVDGHRSKVAGVMAAIIAAIAVTGLVAPSPTAAVMVTALTMVALVAWKVRHFGGPTPPADAAVLTRG